ncbi:MAG: bifunctional diguanylate cyclase/phosphodiesterase [Marinobacterium sp.]|nr:bifunctional diguanylate cyclase/phosphodiesterase [Marinobacterium sp.]
MKTDQRSGARWLVLIVLVFCVSILVSMVQLRATVKLLDYRPGTSIWALFQIKNEYRNVKNQLRLYSHQLISHDDLMLSYDILWSRFPVILKGLDARQLSAIDNGPETIQAAFDDLKILESPILELPGGDMAAAGDIIQRLEKHMLHIDTLALNNYHHNNQFFNKNDERLRTLQFQLGLLLVGILLSGSCLLWLLYRENQRNRYQALHDSLTDMPNRNLLRQKMRRLVKTRTPFALHLLDLNGFKEVNDTLGHHVGDELLKAVALRLHERMALSNRFVVSRLGGDEFAVVQFPLEHIDDARFVAEEILEILTPAVEVEGNLCFVGASIGTALFPQHAERARDLLSRADLAMYQAKKTAPESSFCFFEERFNDHLKRRQRLHHDLRRALEHSVGQLRLEYQPLVNLNTGQTVSLEALLRWDHPDLGAIPPLETIAVAEQYGLSQLLGCWVLKEACLQNRYWRDSGLPEVRIAINIAPSMYRLDLVDMVQQALGESQLPASSLTLEVTEDTTIKQLNESPGVLSGLQSLGVTIALDDFGTGLSSLSHLKALPIQVLKIDRSFVQSMMQAERSCDLVGSIIQLGHTLNMTVVAEGIEDEYIWQALREQGCDIGQGYYFSRPVSAARIPALLLRNSHARASTMA